jgi:hypothetical protein
VNVKDGMFSNSLQLIPEAHVTALSSYELNRQRNNRINGCNCRGIVVMFV